MIVIVPVLKNRAEQIKPANLFVLQNSELCHIHTYTNAMNRKDRKWLGCIRNIECLHLSSGLTILSDSKLRTYARDASWHAYIIQ